MDPLSDILSLMKPGSYGFRGLDAGGDWSLGYAASAGVRCYAIHSGQCWIEVEGQAAPLALSAGDFVLLPGGTAYRLYAGPPSETIDAFRFFPSVPSSQTAVLNGGGDCLGVGDYFHFAGLHASRLLAALPPILHHDHRCGRADGGLRLGKRLWRHVPASGRLFAAPVCQFHCRQAVLSNRVSTL